VDHFKIVVVGASAGGVESLIDLIASLPADFSAAIIVVIHFPSSATSILPAILTRRSKMNAVQARHGKPIEPGRITIAPPDHHLSIASQKIHLSRDARINGHRPAIDPLFQSAADEYGPRTVGVILSGALDDGSAGLLAVKQAGGTALIQDPEDTLFAGMPLNALRAIPDAEVLKIKEIAVRLTQLAERKLVIEGGPVVEETRNETRDIAQDFESFENGSLIDSPSVLTCPECGGVLWESKQDELVSKQDELVQFRYHTGHVVSEQSMAIRQAEVLENALLTAVRVLEERAAMATRLARQAQIRNQTRLQERFSRRKAELESSAQTIK
jgi:two-component system, chemotaxis family, protein-glutamate methylesterase/glutaminase